MHSIMKSMKEARAWILVIGILAILGWGVYSVISTVQKTTEQALAPMNSLTGSIATQVAQVLHPTPTIIPDPVTIINEIRTLARLETIQYTIEKVVTAERGLGTLEFLFGDELIFVAHGYVIAGVDLGKMEVSDFVLDEGILNIHMPAPEIFVATLDNDKSYIYDRDKGIFTKGDINLETAARQVAENEIEKAALEDDILEQAKINAELFLSRLLDDLGFSNVIFIYPEEQ